MYWMIRFTRRSGREIHSVIIAAWGTENGIYFIIGPGRGSGPVIGAARLYRTFHDLLMEPHTRLLFGYVGNPFKPFDKSTGVLDTTVVKGEE